MTETERYGDERQRKTEMKEKGKKHYKQKK